MFHFVWLFSFSLDIAECTLFFMLLRLKHCRITILSYDIIMHHIDIIMEYFDIYGFDLIINTLFLMQNQWSKQIMIAFLPQITNLLLYFIPILHIIIVFFDVIVLFFIIFWFKLWLKMQMQDAFIASKYDNIMQYRDRPWICDKNAF